VKGEEGVGGKGVGEVVVKEEGIGVKKREKGRN